MNIQLQTINIKTKKFRIRKHWRGKKFMYKTVCNLSKWTIEPRKDIEMYYDVDALTEHFSKIYENN